MAAMLPGFAFSAERPPCSYTVMLISPDFGEGHDTVLWLRQLWLFETAPWGVAAQ